MRIRPATDDDILDLIAMQREGWLEDYRGYIPAGYGEYALTVLATPEALRRAIAENDAYLVAEDGGQAVGVIYGSAIAAREAVIWWVHVRRPYRGTGLGRRLIAAFIARLSGHIATLYVSTTQGYTPTIHFYERIGFVEESRTTDAFGPFTRRAVRLHLALDEWRAAPGAGDAAPPTGRGR